MTDTESLSLFLWEILVPTERRIPIGKHKYYRTRYHRVWDEKVRKIAGGLTICFPAKGQWVSPHNELFVEKMIPVKIMCSSEQIQIIADFTATYYDQLAVMYYCISREVYIREYQKNEKRGTSVE